MSEPEPLSFRLEITCEPDVYEATRRTRQIALAGGFSKVAAYSAATAAAELATNALVHGGGGVFEARLSNTPVCLELEAIDHGPGIDDPEQAITEGFSTAGSLGCGLSGVSRLMDELHIRSNGGVETRVSAKKWR